MAKSTISPSKNATVGMSRPHTSLRVDCWCDNDLSKSLCFCQLYPSLINLVLPSWICLAPPSFALVNEQNSSKQNGNICVTHFRVELRLIFILSYILYMHLTWRGPTINSVRILMWESSRGILCPNHRSSACLGVNLKQH